MKDLVEVCGNSIRIKEYAGQRVVTFKDIDTVHQRPDGTARHRFAGNRERFIEGVDYFTLTPKTLENTEMDAKRPIGIEGVSERGTTFLTESGYLMLVKTFTDDLAWDVQRSLVNAYFRGNREPQPAAGDRLTADQGIRLAEIMSTCGSERLAYVVEILRAAGIMQAQAARQASGGDPAVWRCLRDVQICGVPTRDIYERYLTCCEEDGIRPMAHGTFSKTVNRLTGSRVTYKKMAGRTRRVFMF